MDALPVAVGQDLLGLAEALIGQGLSLGGRQAHELVFGLVGKIGPLGGAEVGDDPVGVLALQALPGGEPEEIFQVGHAEEPPFCRCTG